MLKNILKIFIRKRIPQNLIYWLNNSQIFQLPNQVFCCSTFKPIINKTLINMRISNFKILSANLNYRLEQKIFTHSSRKIAGGKKKRVNHIIFIPLTIEKEIKLVYRNYQVIMNYLYHKFTFHYFASSV